MSSTTTTPGMKAETTLTFQMCSNNPFDHKHKVAIMERFARLSAENQAKLETLVLNAQLDEALTQLPADDCKRLLELAGNKKALQKLKQNWGFLKTYIGV